MLNLLATRLLSSRFAQAAGGRASSHAPVLRANTDTFKVMTEEELQEEAVREDRALSLTLAGAIFAASDILWLILSSAMLEKIEYSLLVFLAVDAGLLTITRRGKNVAQWLLVGRGVGGIAWFTLAAMQFGSPQAFPLGQLVLLAGVAILAFGRSGEGKVAAGVVLGLVSVILTFALAFAQRQADQDAFIGKVREVAELAQANRIQEAVDALEKLLEANPKDARIHLFAASFYTSEEARNLDRALQLANRGVELADGTFKSIAYAVLSQVHEARGNFDNALGALNSAVKVDGSNPLLFANRARLLVVLGRIQEAIEDFRRVEKLAQGSELAQDARLQRIQLEAPTRQRVTAPGT